MRVFIGIPFETEVIDYLEQAKSELLKHTIKANATRKENFHLTLLFIGDISNREQEKIELALEQIGSIPRFNLKLGIFGTFNKGKDSIAWIGVKEGLETLNNLQETIVRLINELGYNFTGNYQPHITLARNVIFNNDNKDLNIVPYQNMVIINKIHLFESHQINNVLTYTPIKTISLK